MTQAYLDKADSGGYTPVMTNEKGWIERGEHLSPKTEFSKGQIPWNQGMKMSAKHRKKLSEAHKGQIPWNIKLENKVGKTSLHDWVKLRLGFPKTCEFCGFTSEDPNLLNWANKSGKYKRELSDWLRLCRKCHHKYDNISQKSWITRRAKIS